MKMQSDYAAHLEECLLMMLTNAAFYLELAGKNIHPCLSGMLENFSRILEKHTLSVSEMLENANAPHLNPAYLKNATDNPKADLEMAVDDIYTLKTRLLYLSAYAPDASTRQKLIKITSYVALIADFLSSAF